MVHVSFQAISNKKYILGLGSISVLTLACLSGCQKPQETKAPSATSQTVPTDTHTPEPTANDGKLTVFASTNVWGSVAKAVGGDNVDVIMAVNDPTQDPHDYQASANDKLNVSKSSLVLVNGGGYDDWTTSLANSVANKPVIIDAVKLSRLMPADAATEKDAHHEQVKAETGHDHQHEAEHHYDAQHEHEQHAEAQTQETGHAHHPGGFNEHVFFSLDTAKKVAQAVANQFSQKDPANQAKYAQNAQYFIQKIETLKAKAQAVGQGKTLNAFATEPVTGYLLADMGIQDITPEGFVEQSETDAGVSVKVMNDSQTMLKNKQVNLLLVNAQTEDATSKQLASLAKQSGVAVIPVYETFPQGVTTYTDFIEKTIDSVAVAVKQ